MSFKIFPPRAQLWVGHDRVCLRDAQGTARQLAFEGSDALRDRCTELARTQSRWRGIDVIVSDAHCRYLSLPRIAGTQGRAELAASIAARFASSFGDDPADWLLQHDGALLGSSDLVCALRRDTAEAIRSGLAAARRRLYRLQPLWVWCSQRPLGSTRAPHWLASTDGQTLTLGLFRQQRCVGIRSTRMAHDGLAATLNRETALQAAHDAGTPLWLFGATNAPARLADGSPVLPAALSLPLNMRGLA